MKCVPSVIKPAGPLLEARALVKRLGGRLVVDGVDLVCHAGQVLGLLGPNGAGKTTTLRMLYGFLSADAGAIRFEGADVSRDLNRFKRQLGVCTQEDTFDGDFTVRQNLEVAAGYFRPRPPEVRRRVDELLERFALATYAGDKPEALSGGFRRRLMIARALVHRPRLLFLDEPTTGLDPQARVAVWDLVNGLRAEGLGIVLTTHYPLFGRGRAAARRADRAGAGQGRGARHTEVGARRYARRARRDRKSVV